MRLPFVIIFLIILSGLVYYGCRTFMMIKRKKKYAEYISMPGPYTGREAAMKICSRAGIEPGFYICRKTDSDPFYGNAYLPDKNAFLMTRDIMDGKNLLSTCVGYQLAVTAIRYLRGDLCKELAIEFPTGEYGLRYDFDEEKIRDYLESDID